MTMKLICPKCKEELEEVYQHCTEYHILAWDANEWYKDNTTSINTLFCECPECKYHCEILEDFYVKEEEP